MALHPRAGQTVTQQDLCNIPRLVSEYYLHREQLAPVSFGTSGHRGSAISKSFNEIHIAAICQALVEYRNTNNINGPLFVGMDTHALSECAFATAIEVFAANNVEVRYQQGRGYTPTPVISHAILTHNAENDTAALADGVVITPSHNPPQDGGFKYNPPNGGPADTEITNAIQGRANAIITAGSHEVLSMSIEEALASEHVREHDFVKPYVDDLANVIDMDAIAKAGVKIGVDPLGGSGIAFWPVIAETYGLDITVVNEAIDPSFSFMTLDKDGKIRMDCSSPYAMASLINLKDQFNIAIGNDPDYDRHGIVTPSGLMNPNHYLAVAINYLYTHRPHWSDDLAIGKTLVSSSMIDRVADSLKKNLAEVPVGFKWFVEGLHQGSFGFGGEESAGASFLRKDGTAWSTDKDGIILALLAAEITAVTGKDPSQHYQELTEKFGAPLYTRNDAPANSEQKALLKKLSADDVIAETLAGENILSKLTHAPGNGAAIGGLKVTTENGWFAARPSGTEDIYKIYAESFIGEEHLKQICEEAQAIVSKAIGE